ncbi:hypothetical protein DSECCO2_384820 [anaerobic digester metagenome]
MVVLHQDVPDAYEHALFPCLVVIYFVRANGQPDVSTDHGVAGDERVHVLHDAVGAFKDHPFRVRSEEQTGRGALPQPAHALGHVEEVVLDGHIEVDLRVSKAISRFAGRYPQSGLYGEVHGVPGEVRHAVLDQVPVRRFDNVLDHQADTVPVRSEELISGHGPADVGDDARLVGRDVVTAVQVILLFDQYTEPGRFDHGHLRVRVVQNVVLYHHVHIDHQVTGLGAFIFLLQGYHRVAVVDLGDLVAAYGYGPGDQHLGLGEQGPGIDPGLIVHLDIYYSLAIVVIPVVAQDDVVVHGHHVIEGVVAQGDLAIVGPVGVVEGQVVVSGDLHAIGDVEHLVPVDMHGGIDHPNAHGVLHVVIQVYLGSGGQFFDVVVRNGDVHHRVDVQCTVSIAVDLDIDVNSAGIGIIIVDSRHRS